MKMDYPYKKPFFSKGRMVGFAVIIITTAALSGAGWYTYSHPNNPMLSAYVTQVKDWFAERKSHIHDSLVKVKQIATNKDSANQEVHFEFYTELPNVKVGSVAKIAPPQPVAISAAPSLPIKMVASLQSAKQIEKTEKIADKTAEKITDKPAERAIVTTKNPIVSSAQLERELAQELTHEFKSNKYVIQLQQFKSPATAEEYRIALVDAGFTATIVTTTVAHKNLFRVQVGPYRDKDLAKKAQRQLQKKGISGVLTKLDASDASLA